MQEEVWMSSEQVSEVGVWQSLSIICDEFEFLQHHVLPVLKRQFWVFIEDVDDFLRADLVNLLEIVE